MLLFLSSSCVSTFLLTFENSGRAVAEIECDLLSRINAMKVRSFVFWAESRPHWFKAWFCTLLASLTYSGGPGLSRTYTFFVGFSWFELVLSALRRTDESLLFSVDGVFCDELIRASSHLCEVVWMMNQVFSSELVACSGSFSLFCTPLSLLISLF